jgi:hypothetical protein
MVNTIVPEFEDIEKIVPLFDKFAPIPLNRRRSQLMVDLAAAQFIFAADKDGGPQDQLKQVIYGAYDGGNFNFSELPCADVMADDPAGQILLAYEKKYKRLQTLENLAEKGQQVAPYVGIALATVVAYSLLQAGVRRIPADRKTQFGRAVHRTGAALRRLVPRRRLTSQSLLSRLADRGQAVQLVSGDGEHVGRLVSVGNGQYELNIDPSVPAVPFCREQVVNIGLSSVDGQFPIVITISDAEPNHASGS